jgi:hypothetical protein
MLKYFSTSHFLSDNSSYVEYHSYNFHMMSFHNNIFSILPFYIFFVALSLVFIFYIMSTSLVDFIQAIDSAAFQ